MNERATTPGDRLPLLITVGVFVVMVAFLPLVWMLDRGLEDDRPMYQDMLRMQTYQAAHIANGGRPVEATVSDGGSVKVGSNDFVASPGVALVVRAVDGNSYCISASNADGLKSPEHCSS
ncbi:hypothetical protein [Nocardioides sp.]|uniref:hypothetical protein n=1 Tax=Nocardioides sp. TaxID=35761 RepID=UPI00286DEA8E|nr:hypothetical protein [Nocardioides sp.]